MRLYAFNPGRGGYRRSIATAQKVYDARKTAADFFHVKTVENVIFTPGCTQALNMVVKGILRPGDHVVISSLEHNAVLRPLHKLKEKGIITYSIAQVDLNDDEQTIEHFRKSINEHTRLMICTHASNVLGTRLPTERLCALAHNYQILFCLDAAQSAGIFPIDMNDDGYDFVCCAGHKYLYGPMGIGLLLIGNDNVVESLIEGGTGSVSIDPQMPDFYPDKLEAGTQNICGILGLDAGMRFVKSKEIDNIRQNETRLLYRLYRSLKDDQRVRFIGTLPDLSGKSAPVLSFTVDGHDSEAVVRYLSEKANIAVRGGLHCAPLAHKAVGTLDTGAVRISPSVFTTEQDIVLLRNSLRKII